MALDFTMILSHGVDILDKPMHIDPTLQALIDQSLQLSCSASDQTYLGNDSAAFNATIESLGSQLPVGDYEPPFPISMRDVHMETSADNRSRESPDSTLKPEHKSLKTSGVAVATNEEPTVFSACAAIAAAVDDSRPEAPAIRWKVKEESEVRQTMWRLHHSSPAWKLKVCIDAMKARPIDLATLAQATSVQFASVELVELAANCLDEISKEMEKDESKDSSAAIEASTHDSW